MTDEDKKMVDVLELLLFDNNEGAIKLVPYLIYLKEHRNHPQITKYDIHWVLRALLRKNYIKRIPTKDFMEKEIFKLEPLAIDYARQKLDLGVSEEEFLKIHEAKLEEAGFRMKDINPEKIEHIFQHPDYNKKIAENDTEDFVKSPILEVYKVKGDFYKLINDLKGGRPWSDIEANYEDLYFNKWLSKLYIKDEKPIVISKLMTKRNQQHKLLKYLFDNGKEMQHNYSDISLSKDFSKKLTSQDYKDIVKVINKKIKNSTENRIQNFLIPSSDWVQINPEYIKNIPLLTLSIS